MFLGLLGRGFYRYHEVSYHLEFSSSEIDTHCSMISAGKLETLDFR